ncbi:MAG: porin, partial [Bacteroidia bacterium]
MKGSIKARCLFALVLMFLAAESYSQINSDFVFGKGINFKSNEGDFEIKLQMRFQTLFTADFPTNDFGSIETNTLIRRSRLKLSGKATDRLKFKLEYGLSNRDFSSEIPESGNQANMILDAVLKYKLSNSLSLWFGQTKLPSNRERVISSQNMQLVDRSLLNKYFTLDRDIGFQLRNEHTLGQVILKEYF